MQISSVICNHTECVINRGDQQEALKYSLITPTVQVCGRRLRQAGVEADSMEMIWGWCQLGRAQLAAKPISD
jgi:hypothetical protein